MARSLAVAAVLAAVGIGCHYATDASPSCFAEPPTGTHQSALFRVSGGGTCGTGGVSVTSFAVPEQTFAATIRFRVHGALPGTTYVLQRAAESGRPLASDGICQRAAGVSPWGPGDPPSPGFVTFPLPNPGDPITMTTDSGGDATKEFELRLATVPAGTVFDVQMRLVDHESAPSSEIRSGCMTVIVR
jgi:hypothetical protein